MNSPIVRFLTPVVSSLVGAIFTDLDAFAKAREADKTATFDWTLFTVRVVRAALFGVTGGGIYASIPMSG